MSPWAFLAIGILCEVIATTALKVSNGFSETLPTVVCVVSFTIALAALAQSVKALEIGVVYAIWSGAGITLITLIGLLFFHESVGFAKLLFITMIIIGVVGLQLVSSDMADNKIQKNSLTDNTDFNND